MSKTISNEPFGEIEMDSHNALCDEVPTPEKEVWLPSPKKEKAHKRVAVDLGYDDMPDSLWTRFKRFFANVWHTLKMFPVFLHFAWIDFKKRTCAFFLGFFSVLVVVLMCIVMISLLTSLPIVFMRLGEGDRGEIDLAISPGQQLAAAASLNYSAIVDLFPLTDSPTGYHAPRISFIMTALSTTRTSGLSSCPPDMTAADLWSNRTGYEPCGEGNWMCLVYHCRGAIGPDVTVLGYWDDLERRMGLGRDYDGRAPGPGEAVVSDTIAATLGLRTGDYIVLFGTVGGPLRAVFGELPEEHRVGSTIMRLLIVDTVSPDTKKFPGLDNFVLIDYSGVLQEVGAGLSTAVPNEVRQRVLSSSSLGCASWVNFNMMPSVRDKTYMSSSYPTIRRHVAEWGSGIITDIGYNQITADAPIASFLYSTRMLTIFVSLIISIILTALAFLSIVLIYSLLTVGVETRTYELGIQRMVGFTRESLVAMVLVNAYTFTIPAWLCGIGAGQLVYIGVRAIFVKLVDVQLDLAISGASVGWATLAGLGIPLVAAILPIYSVVTLGLPEALDSARGRSVGVVYKMKSNDARQLNGTMLGLGLLLAVFGFLLYYLFPLSLLNMDLSLMFYIFFAVLLGMLAGLVLLAVNFERVLETVLGYVLLFWENKAVFRMMRKFLSAHRLRNRKTTLMYALSLAFIIFITVAFNIQLTSFVWQYRRTYGTAVMLTSLSIDFDRYAEFQRFAAEAAPDEVLAMTYRYINPFQFLSIARSSVLTSAGRYRQASDTLTAAPPNFFEPMFQEFLLVSKYSDAVRDYALTGSLYSRAAMYRYIVSTSSWNFLGLRSFDDISAWDIEYVSNTGTGALTHYRVAAQTVARLDSAPVLSFSKFPGSFGDTVTSIPNTARLSPIPYASVRAGYIGTIFIKIRTESKSEEVVQLLARYFSSRGMFVTARDITTRSEDMTTASGILDLFFYFTEIMILIICFFSLMSSMTTNVLESSKEVGVLLCLGMSHFQIYRVFIYEAFILVLSAGLLGLVVGVVVAYTMSIQNMLLTEIPMPFTFPYVQLCIIVAMGIISAILASFSPIRYLLGLPSVTHILRRTLT